MQDSYPQLATLPVEVIPLASLADFRCLPGRRVFAPAPAATGEHRRLLIFGVVRPYKGHAELAAAVRLLTMSGLDIHVSVVGEVWQGYRQPLDELAAILPADRLTIVDRYVADAEVAAFFAAAHMVVLPYHRSSASGPLSIAMMGAAGRDHVGRRTRRGHRRLHGSCPGAAR